MLDYTGSTISITGACKSTSLSMNMTAWSVVYRAWLHGNGMQSQRIGKWFAGLNLIVQQFIYNFVTDTCTVNF